MHTIDCPSWTQGNRSHIFIDFINLIIFMRSISRFSICFLDNDLVEIKALWDSVTLHTLKLKAWKDHLLLGTHLTDSTYKCCPRFKDFSLKRIACSVIRANTSRKDLISQERWVIFLLIYSVSLYAVLQQVQQNDSTAPWKLDDLSGQFLTSVFYWSNYKDKYNKKKELDDADEC